ncbi:MAG: hypothetical protein SPF91_01605 [Clostridium sp.]|nr:TetR family transcriptional regulator [Clostridium sp.]MDY5482873.1 hypothetical protein [Clostridium sp.]
MRKEISQRRFVETACRILESEGMDALTTRRIGRDLHCNSANTYYYFKDLDELIVYAAMGSFTDYLKDISRCYLEAEHALDAFRKSWECLIERSVSMPQLYEKILYGKYSEDLGKISASYYRLFPEKYATLEPAISHEITSEDFRGRKNHLILGSCVEEGWFSKEDAEILGEIVKWLHLGLLQELIAGKITADELRVRFFSCMDRTVEAFRKK